MCFYFFERFTTHSFKDHTIVLSCRTVIATFISVLTIHRLGMLSPPTSYTNIRAGWTIIKGKSRHSNRSHNNVPTIEISRSFMLLNPNATRTCGGNMKIRWSTGNIFKNSLIVGGIMLIEVCVAYSSVILHSKASQRRRHNRGLKRWKR
jgi:hypothetical protein